MKNIKNIKRKSIELFLDIASENIQKGEYYSAVQVYQALLKERITSLALKLGIQITDSLKDGCKDFVKLIQDSYDTQSVKFKETFSKELIDTCYDLLNELNFVLGQEGSISNTTARIKTFAEEIKATFSLFSASCMRFKKRLKK